LSETVAAVYEGVNELPGQGCSPPCKGGVAAPLIKSSRSEAAQTGWSVPDNVSRINTSHNDHPVCARFGCFASFYYWRSHPSCSRRGTPLSCQFIHSFIERRYSHRYELWIGFAAGHTQDCRGRVFRNLLSQERCFRACQGNGSILLMPPLLGQGGEFR